MVVIVEDEELEIKWISLKESGGYNSNKEFATHLLLFEEQWQRTDGSQQYNNIPVHDNGVRVRNKSVPLSKPNSKTGRRTRVTPVRINAITSVGLPLDEQPTNINTDCQLVPAINNELITETESIVNGGGSRDDESPKTTFSIKRKKRKLKSDNGFSCSICHKMFNVESKLNKHKLIHVKDRPYICDVCGAGFKAVETLRNHTVLHTGSGKFHCEVCFRRFHRHSQLKLHLRKHSEDRPFICEDCGKGFRRVDTLKNHKLVYHSGEQKKFSCSTCGKLFFKPAQLKLHTLVHTDTRPYVCEVCGQGFKRADNLQRHQPIHTGERAFVCQVCGKAYNNSGALTNHNKIHSTVRTISHNSRNRKQNISLINDVKTKAFASDRSNQEVLAIDHASYLLPQQLIATSVR